MKYTLLEIVQDILSSTDGDEINSISDTTESQQIVTIVKTVYDDILARGDLAVFKTIFNLDASTDALKPVLMTKPLNIDNIYWLKYDRIQTGMTDPAWAEIPFIPLDEFIRMTQMMNPSETDVNSMTLISADGFTFVFNFMTDRSPSYYTSFDDDTLIFDAYDSSVETTLQTHKTLGFGSKVSNFIASDTFVPALQPAQFALLINEAKSLAWSELKQTAHPKAEQTARRNWRHLAKTRQAVPNLGEVDTFRYSGLDKLPNFGRR